MVFPLRGLDLSPYVRKTEGTSSSSSSNNNNSHHNNNNSRGAEGGGGGMLPPISPPKASSPTQQHPPPLSSSSSPSPSNNNSSDSNALWQAVHSLRTTHSPVYDLWGVSNHQGSVNSGHYIAHIYNAAQDKWVCYNDARVYTTSVSSLKGPSAYVLFYVLRDGAGAGAGGVARGEEGERRYD